MALSLARVPVALVALGTRGTPRSTVCPRGTVLAPSGTVALVSALLAFSTVRAIVDFLLLSGGCEDLPKVFGLDIGLGYPLFLNAIYVPTCQRMTR
ncbi:MAG: hypothetical protein IJ256_02965 [Bacteroidaceae bacterium]|nr:hypothetical protein [Bacteroidaceae bacterium]